MAHEKVHVICENLCLEEGMTKKQIETKFNELILNVKQYGVYGDGVHDDTEKIQEIIDNNGGKTIYFPDGIYLISDTIETSQDNDKNVNLQFSKNAIVKASATMDYLFKLGNKNFSNYDFYQENNIPSFKGGQFDCNSMSGGIYSNGYPQMIEDINILNCKTYGIYVTNGYNANSSDNIIRNFIINGIDEKTSAGMYLVGYDNKVTDGRIQGFRRGVMMSGGGNIITNVHSLHHGTFDSDYNTDSVGFYFVGGSYNILNNCYSDTHSVGYKFENDNAQILNDCIAFWYNNLSYNNYALAFQGVDNFNVTLSNFTCNFNGNSGSRKIIYSTRTLKKGTGNISSLQCRTSNYVQDKTTDYALNGCLTTSLSAGSIIQTGFLKSNESVEIDSPIRNVIIYCMRATDFLDMIIIDQWGNTNTFNIGNDKSKLVTASITNRKLTITNGRSGSITYYVMGQISND